MLRFLPYLTLFAALSAPPSACALGLDEYLRQVWQRSAQIGAKRETSEIAENDRWRRFVPNEPQLWFLPQDDGGWQQAGFNLTVPLPGRSFLSMSADAARARSARFDYGATKLDVAKNAMDLFLDCASARKALELQRKSLSDLQTFSRTLERLYEHGHSTQAETLAARLQMRQQESDVALLEAKMPALCERIKAYVGVVDPGMELEMPEDLSPELLTDFGAESADQLRAQAQKEAAAAASSQAFVSQIPDVAFSFFDNRYFVRGSSPVGKPHTNSFQVTVTIPILFPFSELPLARKARADATVQRDQAEIALGLARSGRDQAASEFKRISRRIEALDHEDIPMAEAMVESSLSAYRTGRLGFAELMLSRRLYNDLRQQRLQLQVTRLQLRMRCLAQCEKSDS